MDPAAALFLNTAVAAFPPSDEMFATSAANALLPLVDTSYRSRSLELVVLGSTVRIPQRIHFLPSAANVPKGKSVVQLKIQCLLTRSTDGYQRQAALRSILSNNEPWAIPYVVLLAGEYVVEIAEDIMGASSAFDREAYINFVRENRALVRRLQSKATSYWNCYYRASHADRSKYPGVAFLRQLEVWAS